MTNYKNQVTGASIDDRIDPQARRVAEQLDSGAPAANLAEVRNGFRQAVQTFGIPAEPIYHIRDFTLSGPVGDLTVRLYKPQDKPDLPLLVYFHGGGFIKGDLETHDSALRAIANRSGWAILAVDYHRTPEHAYPTQINEAYTAVKWAHDHSTELGIDRAKMAVGGDSVGGCLAAVTALHARDEGGEIRLIYQLLLYPVTDLTFTSQTQQEFAEGPILYKKPHEDVLSAYVRRDGDLRQPYVSPLFADSLVGLPPALIVTGEFDALRDDGEQYAHRLRQAGIVVTGTRYTGMIHDFLLWGGAIDASKQLIGQAAAALRTVAEG